MFSKTKWLVEVWKLLVSIKGSNCRTHDVYMFKVSLEQTLRERFKCKRGCWADDPREDGREWDTVWFIWAQAEPSVTCTMWHVLWHVGKTRGLECGLTTGSSPNSVPTDRSLNQELSSSQDQMQFPFIPYQWASVLLIHRIIQTNHILPQEPAGLLPWHYRTCIPQAVLLGHNVPRAQPLCHSVWQECPSPAQEYRWLIHLVISTRYGCLVISLNLGQNPSLTNQVNSRKLKPRWKEMHLIKCTLSSKSLPCLWLTGGKTLGEF